MMVLRQQRRRVAVMMILSSALGRRGGVTTALSSLSVRWTTKAGILHQEPQQSLFVGGGGGGDGRPFPRSRVQRFTAGGVHHPSRTIGETGGLRGGLFVGSTATSIITDNNVHVFAAGGRNNDDRRFRRRLMLSTRLLPHEYQPFSPRSEIIRCRPTVLSSLFCSSCDDVQHKNDRLDDGDPSSSLDDHDGATTTTIITEIDRIYMSKALDAARIGFGYTYPNPAVGCVLVDHHHRGGDEDDDDDGDEVVLGVGFHPKAGMPHAEIFALLEAAGHVRSGIEAARSVMEGEGRQQKDDVVVATEESSSSMSLASDVENFLSVYSSDDGPQRLFGGIFGGSNGNTSSKTNVTAYVTLEPCCHYGQTPPCALSLVHAGVKRVVVGYRDPNPRVDGGGVKLLREAGIRVDVMGATTTGGDGKKEAGEECADIVECFVKRITTPTPDYDNDGGMMMTGKHRRVLRGLAGRMKSNGTMIEIVLSTGDIISDNNKRKNKNDDDATTDEEETLSRATPQQLFESTSKRWLEKVDHALWRNELILLRLNDVTKKKKLAKELGRLIAEELGAHVSQVVGHTVLLYRPGSPPILDLEGMVAVTASASTTESRK